MKTVGLSQYKIMMPSTKVRAPRLRASCDGCFLAKVKCSKQRPMCSRCLSCGIQCNYSPSSRAGKPKPESSQSPRGSIVSPRGSIVHNTQPMQLFPGNDTAQAPYLPQTTIDQAFPLEGWTIPGTAGDESMARNLSMSSDISLLGLDETDLAQIEPIMNTQPGFFPSQSPWQPVTNMTGRTFPDVSAAGTQMPFVPSQSIDSSVPMFANQRQPQQQDTNFYTQTQTSPTTNLNYLPSPHATPVVPPALYHNQPGRHCGCFASCLQSLLNLHNASAQNPAPFEMIWNINDKAVDGCATMMACKTCFTQSGGETSVMLLATLFNKIASSYRDAIRSYCGYAVIPDNTPNGNGAYSCDPEQEKMVRAERLHRAVQKLEQQFPKFCTIHQSNMKQVMDDISQIIGCCRTLIDVARSNESSVFGSMMTWVDNNFKEEV